MESLRESQKEKEISQLHKQLTIVRLALFLKKIVRYGNREGWRKGIINPKYTPESPGVGFENGQLLTYSLACYCVGSDMVYPEMT